MSKVKFKLWGVVITLLVLIALAGILFAKLTEYREATKYRVDRLCDYGVEVFAYPKDGEGNNKTAQDALRLCPHILGTLRWGEEAEWTKELLAPIDMLMEQFYQYGYLPREPYDGLDEEYVTAMDAPLLAVTAELAYERGLGEQYRQYMEDLIPYIVQDTTQNGFVLKYSDTEWWPLEYAWKSVSEDDAWFVLNGSLYGMVYVEMLKNLTGDPRLVELSEKTLNAYKAKAEGFLYPDSSWCYYSLNYLDGKKIINPTRKISVELNAYKSLYALTGEPFYQEQRMIRQEMMRKILPVYIVKDGDTNTAMLLRSCAPHPYLIETYENILELLDADGNVVTTLKEASMNASGAYISEQVPDGITSYRLWRYHKLYKGEPANMRLWAEGEVRYLDKSELDTAPEAGSWHGAYDTVSIDNGILTLDPNVSDKLYGHVNFTLSEPAEFTSETYYAIEVTNPTEHTFDMRLYVYDENKTHMVRTLLPLQPGKNILFYTPLGFKEHEWPLSKASLLNLIIVTKDLDEPVELQLGDVHVFQRTADAVNYLSQYEFSDFWVVKGE